MSPRPLSQVQLLEPRGFSRAWPGMCAQKSPSLLDSGQAASMATGASTQVMLVVKNSAGVMLPKEMAEVNWGEQM